MQNDNTMDVDVRTDKPKDGSDFNSDDVDLLLKNRIIDQVEYYFSNVNLAYDKNLLFEIHKDKEGWVSLSFIMTFNRLKNICMDPQTIAYALESSKLLEVSKDWSKVRRKAEFPIPEFDKEFLQKMRERTVIVTHLPLLTVFDAFHDLIHSLNPPKTIQKIILLKNRPQDPYRKALIVFASKDLAHNFSAKSNFTSSFLTLFHSEKHAQKKSEKSDFKKALRDELEGIQHELENTSSISELNKKAKIVRRELMEKMEKKLDDMGVEEYRREKFRKRTRTEWNRMQKIVKPRRKIPVPKRRKGDINKRTHIIFGDYSDEDPSILNTGSAVMPSKNSPNETSTSSLPSKTASEEVRSLLDDLINVLDPPDTSRKEVEQFMNDLLTILDASSSQSVPANQDKPPENRPSAHVLPENSDSSTSSSQGSVAGAFVPIKNASNNGKNGSGLQEITISESSSSSSETPSDGCEETSEESEDILQGIELPPLESMPTFYERPDKNDSRRRQLSSSDFRPGLILKLQNLPDRITKGHIYGFLGSLMQYFPDIKRDGRVAHIDYEAALNTAYVRFASYYDNYACIFWGTAKHKARSHCRFKGNMVRGSLLKGAEEAGSWGDLLNNIARTRREPIIRQIRYKRGQQVQQNLQKEGRRNRLEAVQAQVIERTRELREAGWGDFMELHSGDEGNEVNENEPIDEDQQEQQELTARQEEEDVYTEYLAGVSGLTLKDSQLGVYIDGRWNPWNNRKLYKGQPKGDITKRKHIIFSDSDGETPQQGSLANALIGMQKRNAAIRAVRVNQNKTVFVPSSDSSSDDDDIQILSTSTPSQQRPSLSSQARMRQTSRSTSSSSSSSSSDSEHDSETPGQLLKNPIKISQTARQVAIQKLPSITTIEDSESSSSMSSSDSEDDSIEILSSAKVNSIACSVKSAPTLAPCVQDVTASESTSAIQELLEVSHKKGLFYPQTSKSYVTNEVLTEYDFYGHSLVDYYTKIGYYTPKTDFQAPETSNSRMHVQRRVVESQAGEPVPEKPQNGAAKNQAQGVYGSLVDVNDSDRSKTPRLSSKTQRRSLKRLSDQAMATPRRSQRLSSTLGSPETPQSSSNLAMVQDASKSGSLTSKKPNNIMKNSSLTPKTVHVMIPKTAMSAAANLRSGRTHPETDPKSAADKPSTSKATTKNATPIRRSTRAIVPVKRLLASASGKSHMETMLTNDEILPVKKRRSH